MLANSENQLKSLDMSDNKLGNIGLYHINKWVSLEDCCQLNSINLNNCKLKGKFVDAFALNSAKNGSIK